jgi:hypothetical protein
VPRKDYFYYLDGVTRLVVYFSTRKGEVLRFVVKLEYFCDGEWRELLRHDCFHGYVHKDVLARSGGKKRVVKYGFFDPGTGLNASIADCVENYQSYIERWSNVKP